MGANEEEGTVTVEPEGGGITTVVKASETHRFDPSHESDLDDAAQLNNLHEAPLLNLITSRFHRVHHRKLFLLRPAGFLNNPNHEVLVFIFSGVCLHRKFIA